MFGVCGLINDAVWTCFMVLCVDDLDLNSFIVLFRCCISVLFGLLLFLCCYS